MRRGRNETKVQKFYASKLASLEDNVRKAHRRESEFIVLQKDHIFSRTNIK